MREILFRGKKIDSGEWIYGDLVRLKDGRSITPYIYGEGEVVDTTIGQYTGLCDKNGTKIFEGDILENKQREDVLEVVFEDQLGAFMVIRKSDDEYLYFSETRSDLIVGKLIDCEIIGNIYDNPELLEEIRYENRTNRL